MVTDSAASRRQASSAPQCDQHIARRDADWRSPGKNPRIGRTARARHAHRRHLRGKNIEGVVAAGGIAQINHPQLALVRGHRRHGAALPNGTLFEVWNGIREISNLGGTDDKGNVALVH